MTTLSLFALGALAGLGALTSLLMSDTLLILLLLCLRGEGAGHDAQREHREREDERACPRELLLFGVGAPGELVDDERKARHRSARIEGEERIAERGEDQGRGFAGHARNR